LRGVDGLAANGIPHDAQLLRALIAFATMRWPNAGLPRANYLSVCSATSTTPVDLPMGSGEPGDPHPRRRRQAQFLDEQR
jgi:hypothetical protein